MYCKELEKKLENFLSDPMTIAMGASDCSDLIVSSHMKTCSICNPQLKVVKKGRVTNRFQRFSGVYECRCCGRKTRSTGRGDNEHVKLCAECYDLSGIENLISDSYGGNVSEVPNDIKIEVNSLYNEIVAKGGTPNFDYMDLIEKKS